MKTDGSQRSDRYSSENYRSKMQTIEADLTHSVMITK